MKWLYLYGFLVYVYIVLNIYQSEIKSHPERFVTKDPEMPQTILDLKEGGKSIILITNSDYEYTDRMMSFAYNDFLPEGMRWSYMFDMVIVNARKPNFFNLDMSLYEIVNNQGLMKPAERARKGGLYCGGTARMVENGLNVKGSEVLYVGDHIYTDNALAKLNFR